MLYVRKLAILLVSVLVFSGSALAASPFVVSVDWLKKNINDPELVLLDASTTFNYLDKHIPGAVSVSFTEKESLSQEQSVSYGGGIDFLTDPDAPYPFQDLPMDKVQQVFRKWGISSNSKVVVYDQGAFMLSTRLFYSLKYWGVNNVYLLDGGVTRWQAAGNPVTTSIPPAPKLGNITLKGPDNSILADTAEVLAASGTPEKVAIIDALGDDFHYGVKPFYARKGHIPFAISLNRAVYYNEDKTLKSREEIRAILQFYGITPDKTVYTQCGGGIAGSMPFFVLKYVAQFPNVKHYRGSLVAWEYDVRELPMWTYDAPYRLRDNAWLTWWPGQRTRALGNVQTSLIDIRGAKDYALGHVPYALNIPFDVFRNHLHGREALAKQLGAAGVNKNHEAVVFADGVDKRTALVAWMLETMGQRTVSIASQDMQQWLAAGYKPQKTSPEVRAHEVPFDLAVAPTVYTLSSKSALVGDVTAPRHTFPKIYLESGEKPGAVESKLPVVHIPASGALGQKGLKDAAALYTYYGKTHKLPRLAEIVCVATDPADAALNWFALTMLGYPNVKVLLK